METKFLCGASAFYIKFLLLFDEETSITFKWNVFVKTDGQSQACLSFAMARKGAMKWNVFDKPDEQSQACLSFGREKVP